MDISSLIDFDQVELLDYVYKHINYVTAEFKGWTAPGTALLRLHEIGELLKFNFRDLVEQISTFYKLHKQSSWTINIPLSK